MGLAETSTEKPLDQHAERKYFFLACICGSLGRPCYRRTEDGRGDNGTSHPGLLLCQIVILRLYRGSSPLEEASATVGQQLHSLAVVVAAAAVFVTFTRGLDGGGGRRGKPRAELA